MTRDEILVVAKQRTDAMNRHDIPGLVRLYGLAAQVESPLAGTTIEGRSAIEKVFRSIFTAFPDLQLEPDHYVVDGDMVAASSMMTGAYNGGFMGIPATGKPMRVPTVTLSRIVDGEIVWERRVYDITSMLIQSGILRTSGH